MQGEFDFRTVECPFTWLQVKGNAIGFQCFGQRLFGFVPHFVGADPFFRPCRQLDLYFFKAKSTVHIKNHFDAARYFRLNLFFSTEDVRIVLSETTHAHQAMQAT